MRRSRKSRSTEYGVSLFPFLAVLICTLGVLIVLLVLAVKAAESDAISAKDEIQHDVEERITEIESEMDFHMVRIDGFSAHRDDEVEVLNEAKSIRSQLEHDLRQLRKDETKLKQQLANLQKQASDFVETEDLEELAESLEKQIQLAKSELESKRQDSTVTRPVMYSIVPHEGPGGTNRHPIFVECRMNKLVLQPYGIELTGTDFAQPMLPGNPLDSALLAVREYFQEHQLSDKHGLPYPLLVVRPDGAKTYAAARKAMASWDDEFGYELIEAEKQLDFGTRDPYLAQEVEQAILDARTRQREIASSREFNRSAVGNGVAGGNGAQPRPGLVASGFKGGFVNNGAFSSDESSNRQASMTSGNDVAERIRKASHELDSIAARGPMNPTANPSTGSVDAAQGGQLPQALDSNTNSQVSPIARQRGADWGLPSRTSGGSGYLRPIRLFCGPDRIEIQATPQNRVHIPVHSETVQSIDPMIDVIWKMVDSWGIAGADAYWKPDLRVSILPGGEQRFEDLKVLLLHSGLKISEVTR